MTIRSKLLTIVASLSVCIVLAVLFSVYQDRFIGKKYADIIENDVKASTETYAVGRFFNAANGEMLRALIQTDINERQKCLMQMEYFHSNTDKHLRNILSKDLSPEGQAAVKQIQEDIENYRRAAQLAVIPLPDGNINIAAVEEAESYLHSFREHAPEMFRVSDMATANAVHDLEAHNNFVLFSMLACSIILVGLVIYFSLKHVNALVDRIKNLCHTADYIAAGDLSVPFEAKADDELGTAAESFDRMRRKMLLTIAEISNSADMVATGAKNVSDTSVSLSQGSTEQAASVEELAAAMAKISAQTANNAESANRAAELSRKAKVAASEGNQSMMEMLRAMEEINISSTSIFRIIKVIDEIAFQTNILALNAAVEAARAGQHGKGFAVVADEVRSLAARSAKAAKETAEMIECSIDRVADGRRIAQKTATTLGAIVNNVDETAGLVDTIAVASNEQKNAISLINDGLLQVSKVTETNSASSEETASASEELSRDAFKLNKLAGRFKLGTAAAEILSASMAHQQSSRPAALSEDGYKPSDHA